MVFLKFGIKEGLFFQFARTRVGVDEKRPNSGIILVEVLLLHSGDYWEIIT